MSWEGFFASLDRLRLAMADFAGITPRSHCRLHSADGEGVLVCDNASLVSLIRVDGSLRLMGEAEYLEACSVLTDALSPLLAGPGHALQVVFACDPEEAPEETARALAPARAQARALGLDLARVLDDWAATLAGHCAAESLHLAVWTTPALMSAAARDRAFAEAAKAPAPRLRDRAAMRTYSSLTRLRDAHRAAVRDLLERLSSLHFKAELLDCHAAARTVRAAVCPMSTSPAWRACLPGDRLPVRLPDVGSDTGPDTGTDIGSDIGSGAGHAQAMPSSPDASPAGASRTGASLSGASLSGASGSGGSSRPAGSFLNASLPAAATGVSRRAASTDASRAASTATSTAASTYASRRTASMDASSYVWPSLACQIWPQPVTVREGRYAGCDGRLHAPFVMSLPPQTVQPFAQLFRTLLSEDLPFRLAVLLTGDGLRGTSLRRAAAAILSFASSSSEQVKRSYTALAELALQGETVCGLQVTLDTWVRCPGGVTAELKALLARRAARLACAVQAWGSCDTELVTGDPVQALAATVPGMTMVSPAVKAAAPLSEAVRLLPLFRPCSPWSHGEVPLRSPDGRLMPFSLFSPAQASWNEICFAGMGSGKSFYLNTLNFFYLLKPGLAQLPLLTVIDVGPSSAGVIELVRAALPPERRHLAVFAPLRNARSCAVNPFDTLLGVPYPLPAHGSFLINFLALLCTPLAASAPADGVTDILREALDAVYRRLAPDGEAPKRYDAAQEPAVAGRLKTLGFTPDAGTTWWEIVRLLFDAGEIALAHRAQRQAAPLLADVMVELSSPLLRSRFAGLTEPGSAEGVCEACSRRLTTALREYPILAAPTRFDLGGARVAALDLAEVTPRGGPAAERQSGLMYMLARHAGASRFFNAAGDLEFVPEHYREWHRAAFEETAATPKRLCYDEFHRASCADPSNPLTRQILADLTTASREARKQNLSICLYSQQLEDFPKVLVDLATTVCAMGAGNAAEAMIIGQRFGLNAAAVAALRRGGRPTAAGAGLVALFRTSAGESVCQLVCTAGSWARWAFSTTAEDMRVRARLYRALGPGRALEVLAAAYPEGTVRMELERRRLALECGEGAGEGDGGAADLVAVIASELEAMGRRAMAPEAMGREATAREAAGRARASPR